MDQLDALQAKIDISEMAARYAHAADHPGWDGIYALFAEDAVFDASAVYDRVMSGMPELRDFFENAPDAVAHHPTSQFTQVHEDGTAQSMIKMLVFFHRTVFSVDYEWQLRRQDARWLITRQTINVVGKAALAAGRPAA